MKSSQVAVAPHDGEATAPPGRNAAEVSGGAAAPVPDGFDDAQLAFFSEGDSESWRREHESRDHDMAFAGALERESRDSVMRLPRLRSPEQERRRRHYLKLVWAVVSAAALLTCFALCRSE